MEAVGEDEGTAALVGRQRSVEGERAAGEQSAEGVAVVLEGAELPFQLGIRPQRIDLQPLLVREHFVRHRRREGLGARRALRHEQRLRPLGSGWESVDERLSVDRKDGRRRVDDGRRRRLRRQPARKG